MTDFHKDMSNKDLIAACADSRRLGIVKTEPGVATVNADDFPRIAFTRESGLVERYDTHKAFRKTVMQYIEDSLFSAEEGIMLGDVIDTLDKEQRNQMEDPEIRVDNQGRVKFTSAEGEVTMVGLKILRTP